MTPTNQSTPFTTPRPSSREDFWTEEASATLIDAWGRRYLELNRGNLRQKDWQHVADLVNARHPKTFRTDVQCKNRVDTIKKKYKAEKAKSAESGGIPSSWPFFDRLHHLVGPTPSKPAPPTAAVVVAAADGPRRSRSPPIAVPLPFGFRKSNVPLPTADLLHRDRALPPPPDANLMMKRKQSVEVSDAELLLPKKRPLAAVSEEDLVVKKRAVVTDDSYFRRNYSAVAAAAAAAAAEEEEESEEESEEEEEEGRGEEEERREGVEVEEGEGEDGIRKLAGAIKRFGEVYERVEGEKQSQMIELEKERMKLAKELELQRMQMFVNMQLQIKKIRMMTSKRGCTSSSAANGETS